MYLKSHFIQLGKNILIRFPKKVFAFFSFIAEFGKFKRMADNRFSVKMSNIYPCLSDSVSTTPFDQHYIYHPAWAARVLAETKPEKHIDISSILSFSATVSAFIPMEFYDYRPAELQLNNFKSGAVDLCKMPFETESISSLSCMHTVEHIGLGRYGDAIDPTGDLKAIAELQRVTKPGGQILFVTPVGKSRIEFNAHRVYSYQQIIESFGNCEIKEFSLIPDQGGLIVNADKNLVQVQHYGCGCFWFIKK